LTSTGKPWNYMRLRDVLIRPRNAGKLSKGRYDRGTGEIVGKALWPANVDEETWRAVHKLLIDPSRRKRQGNAVRWLGSGIYTCSKCDGSMRCTAIGGHNSQRGGPHGGPADTTTKTYAYVLLRLGTAKNPRTVCAGVSRRTPQRSTRRTCVACQTPSHPDGSGT
jgi:site-specific DNA recombinase